MKIKDGFILSSIADNFVVIPTGDNVVNFNAMMTLNETGAFLWELLTKETTALDLVSAMTDKYDIDAETATEDIAAFIELLKQHDLLIA